MNAETDGPIRFESAAPQFSVPDVVRTADILDGPEMRSYGRRELVVSDCNGLILAFGEEMPAPS